MVNKWKVGFIVLLLVNVTVLVTIAYLIGLFTPTDNEDVEQSKDDNEVHFNITSTKNELNDLIAQYLANNNKKNKISYHVILGDDIQMIGTITAFGKKVSLFMNFEPKVRSNGDLILQETSIKIGKLQLPDRRVLQYIKDYYEFPNWVIVQPESKTVYVALNALRLKNDVKIKANTFNLRLDDISFDVSILP
jgi:uncharacterized protein YpmS